MIKNIKHIELRELNMNDVEKVFSMSKEKSLNRFIRPGI